MTKKTQPLMSEPVVEDVGAPSPVDLRTTAGAQMSLVEFLESLDLNGLDLTREPDCGRDIEL